MNPRTVRAWRIGLPLVLAIAFALSPGVAAAIEPGQTAPEITASDAQGQLVQLASLRGKLVYVDFWASWCAPCRRSFPWMNEMQQKYGAGGLTIVGVNVDQKRLDAERFLVQVPAKFTMAYDATGATPKVYGIKGMPSSVLIDGQGRVLMVHTGFRDEDRDALEAKIREALPQRIK